MLATICDKSLYLEQTMARTNITALKHSTTKMKAGINKNEKIDKLLPKKSKTNGKTKKLWPKINSWRQHNLITYTKYGIGNCLIIASE